MSYDFDYYAKRIPGLRLMSDPRWEKSCRRFMTKSGLSQEYQDKYIEEEKRKESLTKSTNVYQRVSFLD